MLSVAISKQLGEFTLDVAFKSGGRVLGLYGPSGAGKSTLINVVAGLIAPDRGTVICDNDTLDDTTTRTHIPAHRRRIGYVFQDARLFPHLDVRGNLDYGRRMNGLSPDEGHAARIAKMLDIGELTARRVAQLSGGERQRVALGRALLSKPRLLLLDEPMASLDEARKAEILPYLTRLRDEANVPMVIVSHDAEEMRQLASDVVMLKAGRVVASGGVDLLRAI